MKTVVVQHSPRTAAMRNIHLRWAARREIVRM